MLNRNRLRTVWRRVLPDRIAGTLSVRHAGDDQSAFDDYAVPRMRWKRLSKDQVLAVGVDYAHLHRAVVIFKDALDEVDAPEPKNADKLSPDSGEDAGTEWIVRSVERKLMGECFECIVHRAG